MAKSGRTIRLVTAVVLSIILAHQASAALKTTLWELYEGIKTIAAALGVLMIAYSGVGWIMADGPQERDEAKKTLVYVMIGLLVVALALDIVGAVYCSTLESTTYGGGIC